MKKVLVSIIIPVKEINDYLRKETIPAILGQSFQNFEIIILPDKPTKEKFPKTKIIPSWPKLGPADKRDLGAKKAKGEILAFLDDDSYPSENWLENAVKIFNAKSLCFSSIAAVCGPTITPPKISFREKISGYVWGSSLGSRGAGFYRYIVAPRREVDDFPTANLLVIKSDFWKVGGFNTHFWSGEDTKLCFRLTKELGKKIVYDPRVLVYHHRREIFRPHLIQIARYGLHRGHFARIMPQTSLRVGYFLPSIFTVGLFCGPVLGIFSHILLLFYLLAISVYLLGLFLTGIRIFSKEKSLKSVFLVMLAIFLTHLIYGVFFIKGFLTPNLKSKYGC